MRLFISYAHENEVLVREQLVEILETGGHDVWFDHDLLPGQDWKAELLNAIVACDVLVYAMTAHSLDSEWCQWELKQAIEHDKAVIPVLLEKVKIPASLKDIQYVDFTGGATVQSVAKLMGGLQHLTASHIPSVSDEPSGLPAQVKPAQQQSVQEPRRLEAAMPAQSKIDAVTELRVKVSLPDSKGLRGELPVLTQAGDLIQKSDVSESGFSVRFPVDANGQKHDVQLCIRVKTDDFAVRSAVGSGSACEEDQFGIELSPQHDSRTVIFELMPRTDIKSGRARVLVNVYQDREVIGEIMAFTNIVEVVEVLGGQGPWNLMQSMLLQTLAQPQPGYAGQPAAGYMQPAPVPMPEIPLPSPAAKPASTGAPTVSLFDRKANAFDTDGAYRSLAKRSRSRNPIILAFGGVILLFLCYLMIVFAVLTEEQRQSQIIWRLFNPDPVIEVTRTP